MDYPKMNTNILDNNKVDTDNHNTSAQSIAYAPTWAQAMASAFKSVKHITVNGVTYTNM